MKYKLLLLDIDGTLRPGSCERVPKENAEAVCAVQKAGVKIAIATGRGRIGVGKGLLRSIRPDYWVCAGGAQLVDEAVVCPHCGCAVAPTKTVDPNASPKSRLITLLLCIFVGGLGIHRFYVGKIGTGVLWLLTAGCFGIGALVDLIMIACGTFTDSDGKPVTDWQT